VSSLLLAIGVSACGAMAPRHDYPGQYPVAEGFGACPNLNGTFQDTGTLLGKSTSTTGESVLLSRLLLAPVVVPSTASVNSLQLHGPAQGLLLVDVLMAEGTVAHASIPTAAEADGFMDSKPFSSYVCDRAQGANLVVTNDPVTGSTKSSNYKVVVRIYRAKDGSLIAARERIYTDFLGVDVARQWFRFQEASARSLSVVQ
jgi:hypothetical protein